MKWRLVLELVGADGAVGIHEVSGGAALAEYAPRMIGLTLAEGKHMLAAVQDHLVRAQTADHCRRRRRCQRCRVQRPVKDQRSRRLVSLFGMVEVRAPRFAPCRCAVTCRRTLSPVAEIMPDRCTPEYEQVIAKMGSLLPYRRARTLLSEFLPLAKPQTVEPRASERFVLVPGWSGKPSPGSGPSRRPRRKRSRAPSTAVRFERLVCTRGARSRFSSPRSATMRRSRSCSAACRRRTRRRDS
jgi:hypothetical protein